MTVFLEFWRIFFTRVPDFLPYLLRGALVSLEITLTTLVISAVFGLFVASLQRLRWLRIPIAIYIEVARSAPVITTLFIIYFGLSSVGLRLGSFAAAVIALSALGLAYMAEIFRAGIEAVHKGQREAALSIGMTPLSAMQYIILPQALKVVIPPSANYAIGLLKDTAVVSTVAAPELLFEARALVSEFLLPMQIYILTAILYLVMSLSLASGARWIEGRLMRSM